MSPKSPQSPQPPQTLHADRDYPQTKTVSLNLSLWISLAALIAFGSSLWLKGGELPWQTQPFPNPPELTLPNSANP